MASVFRSCLLLRFHKPFCCRLHLHTVGGSGQSRDFISNLRHYVTEHMFLLGAVEAFGSNQLNVKKESAIVSENFNESGYWTFEWCVENEISPSLGDVEGEIPGVQSTTVFAKGYDAIKRYIDGEVQDEHTELAFEALKRFYLNKGKHEMSVMTLHNTMSDMQVCSILSQHLLSQLLPHPSNYFLNNHMEGKPDGCPCGCGEPINFGTTQLGSPYLFQGCMDMVFIPTNRDLFMDSDSKSAGFTFRRRKNETCGHKFIRKDWMNTYEYDDDISAREFIAETKYNNESKFCKQAISMSLCKYNKILSEKDSGKNQWGIPMMPVVAITSDSYEIAIYDAKNDYLLFSSEPSHLFEEGYSSCLRFSAVVDLWLLIHHNLFCTQPEQDTINELKGTCNLISQLGQKKYQYIVKNSKWLYLPEINTKSLLRISRDKIKLKDSKMKAAPVQHLV